MSGIFTIMIIVFIVGTILSVTRNSRPSIGSDFHRPQIGPGQPMGWGQPPYGQPGYGQHGYGQMMPFGQPYPQGYDPAAMQPMAPGVRQAIDSDITTFGDELRDLDLDVVGRTLDPASQADYTMALDAYDGAKQQLERAQSHADVRRIAETLEKGRYAIACVKARVNGQPIPAHRPPCFFDPAHGVSAENVSWAPPGGAVRDVPACAADAQRVKMGADPSIRMVAQGPMQVPYWEDRGHAAWVQGYYRPFGADPALRSITQGALMIGGFSLLMGLLDD